MGIYIYKEVLMIVFISILWMNIVFADKCTNWTLTGSSVQNEGMVTVFYDGTWVNICAESLNDTYLENVCREILKPFNEGAVFDGAEKFDSNLFSSAEQDRSISYESCQNVDVTDNTTSKPEHKCKLASLCCSEASTGPCSTNWADTRNLDTRHYSREAQINQLHLRYSQLMDVNFTNLNISKSWTRSALQEEPCIRNQTYAENDINSTVKNCSKSCPVKSDLSFVLLSNENKTCCLERNSRTFLVEEDGSIRNLSVIDQTTNASTILRFCLAAEVIKGHPFVSIEDCDLFFQPFRVPEEMVQPRTTERTRQIQSSDSTTTTVATPISSTQAASDVPKTFNVVMIVCVSLLVLVLIVFAIVIRRKFKKNDRTCGQQRPNSVSNRTYIVEGFQHLSSQDDEEYTLISDMEIEHVSAEAYRPQVPKRGNIQSSDKNDKSGTEIITLEEYSTPSDQVRVGYKISQTSDYCMTTYDDPVRLKGKDLNETHRKSDCAEDCVHDSTEEQPKRTDSENNSKIMDTNLRNSQINSSPHDTPITDLETDARNSYENTVIENARNGCDESKTVDTTQALQKETVEKRIVASEHLESFKFPGIKSPEDTPTSSTKESDTNSANNDDNGSDYEDPDIIDGNFRSTCTSKRVLEEHVCLDCLKPEHLTKLGIKLISEEMYEKHNDLDRSFSEPSSQKQNYNFESRNGEKVSETELKNPEGQKYNVKHGNDTLTEMKFLRRNKDSCIKKRCSVCHTVYERLGKISQNDWADCTDNVYDRFGDFKHFKHRQRLSGKRVNST